MMIKPCILKKGDTVALVSLSSGMIGDKPFIHKYHLGKERLEKVFGLMVATMPNTLMGSKFIYEHPELRAKDFMNAFNDPDIKAIISCIGGNDSIRMLPYIDFEKIKRHPKIFLGFSDSTISHLIMYKAGVTSFYGPALMTDFAEYTKMFDYTVDAIKNMLFKVNSKYEIKPSKYWTPDYLSWAEENMDESRKLIKDDHGYELLQGKGVVKGALLGGCIETLQNAVGTSIWPTIDEWKGKILFLETSEDHIQPNRLKDILRNFAAQGIFNVISGILVGKPHEGMYYDEYKECYKTIISGELKNPALPILYNVNFGHASPIGILPYGALTELNCKAKRITILETFVSPK